MTKSGGADGTDSAEGPAYLARLSDVLPDATPLGQAIFLLLAERGEAKLAALAKALDLPLALVVRGASELTGLTDERGAPLATLAEGASPGAGLLRLTPAGADLAHQLAG
ncbi:hypothetical protein [Pedomonas mirosovicensis]|uniref:hypothetical protein n=1 Tax=Pedomonas mirosovicensis TaxID=2908641 RepID=UPI00216A0D26|nr:hypothetical protein [Pedomonas mirosovicensis]MCH8685168.1 hypothetical protein [Pedomonas mirosovicensis]